MKLGKKLTCIFLSLCLLFSLTAVSHASEITYETWTDGGVDGYPSDDILALFQKKTITASGMSITLGYRLYVPADYDPNVKYPVVLFFHGYGERGSGNDVQLGCGMMKDFFSKGYYKDHPCIIIAPQCPSSSQWAVQGYTGSYTISDTPSTNTFTEAIQLSKLAVDQTIKDYNVDTNRLYVTGLSMGGYGTWNIITHYPDYFAAAAPLCGGGDPSKASRLVNIPIWCFHGSADPTVPVSGTRDMYNAITAAGGQKIHYTEWVDKDHYIWSPTYARADLWNWMFNQSKAGETMSTDELSYRTASLKTKNTASLSDADRSTVNSAIRNAESVIAGTDRSLATVSDALTRIRSARALFSSDLTAAASVIGSGAETEDRFKAENIADGDASSAWQVYEGKGVYGENVWVGFDLGSITTFDELEICWEDGTKPSTDQFVIQVSYDGIHWTSAASKAETVASDGQNTTVTFAPTDGRFIRVLCSGGKDSKYFPKIYEMKVFGKLSPNENKAALADLASRSGLLHAVDASDLIAATKESLEAAKTLAASLLTAASPSAGDLSAANGQTQTALDASTENLALAEGVTTIATEFAYTDHTPANINDGDLSTGWQLYDGVNEITVTYDHDIFVGYDFGKAVTFNSVELCWEAGSRPNKGQYTLQISADGSNWTDIADQTVLGLDGTVDAVIFPSVTSRYLRVKVTGGRDNKYYPKVCEVAVYGKKGADYTAYFTLLFDADCDGSVTAADLTAIARHVGNIEALTNPTSLANASASHNGVVSAADLTAAASRIARIS